MLDSQSSPIPINQVILIVYRQFHRQYPLQLKEALQTQVTYKLAVTIQKQYKSLQGARQYLLAKTN